MTRRDQGQPTAPRAVIYARYSSENQREASIEDQIRICRDRIEQEGWHLIQVYRDAGISEGLGP